MSDQTQDVAQGYSVDQITVLEGLEAVRRRPGMYIGSTDIRGLHHLIYEVVDNAIDEALAGVCDRVDVVIHTDNSVSVSDNGRGIPVGPHPKQKDEKGRPMDTLDVVMTILHAGGKFGDGGYKVASGLHGVGVSAVNALSEWMETTVRRDGKVYRQRYERGVPQGKVQTSTKIGPNDPPAEHGTRQHFYPDTTIFKAGIEYKFETLIQRFREMAFLTRQITLCFRDERDGHEMTFYFEGGVRSFVGYLNRNRDVLHPVVYVTKEMEGTAVECAIQYTDGYNESVFSFANNINTVDGGTHLTGFRTALTRTVNDYARKGGFLKDGDTNFTGEDTREGLTAVVSIKLHDPQFESQTKSKLGNAEVKGHVESIVTEMLGAFLEEHPREAKEIINKCLTSSRAREAARQARDLVIRKSALESLSLPGKLADCSERDSTKTEVFIVEGDSAGGCFAGETEVALASGVVKTLRELADDWALGIQHFGYATNEAGDVRVVPLIAPRLTKRQARLVEVVLDNGARFRCTPDHLFRMRDGAYKAACTLQAGESLMPLKVRLTEADEQPRVGYEMVWMNGEERWVHTHHLADLYNLLTGVYTRKAGNVRHIGDANRLNGLALASRVLGAENLCEAYEGLRREVASTALSYSRLLSEYYQGDESSLRQSAANYNCKVVSVRELDECADVYDLTVDRYHNFALAGGVFVHNSAKQGRDRHFQAILPLRGKILNTERARLDKILQNNEVKALIAALGVGIGDNFDLKGLRYGRVILLCDADVDGSHIRTLLLTFFFRYMQTLIEEGHLFIAQPPLYRVEKSKEVHYVHSDAEKDALVAKFGGSASIQRYKGLGEMNPQQLWDTTLDPEHRTLLQVTIEDAAEADKTFDMLMGNAVPPRRRFITTHAKDVRNLDV